MSTSLRPTVASEPPADHGAPGVGLDIGATKTLGVIADAGGTITALVQEATEPGAEGVLRTAARVLAALRRESGAPLPGPVGVGVPGLVDVAHGSVAHAVNLGVDGFALGPRLAALLATDVVVDNDVNAAALGAMAVSGQDDLLYLSIGTGVAAGLVLDGRLRRGAQGAAGEVGHVPVDPDGPRCGCGQRGCLETVASGRALATAWPSARLPPAQALFAAAAAGDARAIVVRDRFASALADAVRVLSLAVDARSVVLGGGVAQVGEPLRAAVSEALLLQATSSPFLASLGLAQRVQVVPAGYPVAAVGAALLGRAGGSQ